MGEILHTDLDSSASPARLEYTSEKHSRHTLEAVNLLRLHRELCDVVLLVGNRKIFAHRIVLSACSPYFHAMFTGELAESRQTEVTIRDIDEHAMELLMDFAYTSHIVVEEGNVQMLLPAACLLQMAEIQDVCCEFLKRQLDPTNCLGIRAFADTHSCRELLRIADKFTQHNFQEARCEEFLLLPVNQLVDIISSDELNVRSEEQVFSAVMSWVKYNVTERRQNLGQVLQHVRLPLLSPKFLVGTVGSDLLIKSDEVCRDLVDEAKNYLLLPQERPLMQGPRTRPRKPVRRGEVLFAGERGNAGADDRRKKRRACAHAYGRSERKEGNGSARSCGGWHCALVAHDETGCTQPVQSRFPAPHEGLHCFVNGSIKLETLQLCATRVPQNAVTEEPNVREVFFFPRYDPQTNRWTKVAPMSTKRLGVAVAVLGSYLYAMGGSDGTSPLNTVERYDPRTNRWSSIASMGTRRKHLGCAVYSNMIYAVGGRDDTTELSSAERYNPQLNQWQPIVAMTSRRSGVGLAVVNGLLYAVGGFDGTTYLKTIEVYDPEQNQWKLCGSMNYRRLGGGVGVVRLPQHEAHYW
ncbi:conserved hypothetical protein [Ixodes scapularis]|uniref:Kelch-like protein diablo n=1 Tax=Ixodes scapularis TaxID=6945 RepID=B7P1U9_IXOSC|nr:conserved hypothetical protein [Ixodes scapularis]|eukprot:XP_002433507.1 conserved hypothetical protein [Ixodes scapularis]